MMCFVINPCLLPQSNRNMFSSFKKFCFYLSVHHSIPGLAQRGTGQHNAALNAVQYSALNYIAYLDLMMTLNPSRYSDFPSLSIAEGTSTQRRFFSRSNKTATSDCVIESVVHCLSYFLFLSIPPDPQCSVQSMKQTLM